MADVAGQRIPEQGLSMMATLDMKWEAVVRVLPFLHHLDFLPRFSLLMGSVLVVLAVVFWCILRSDGGDADADAPPPKRSRTRKKKTKKPAAHAANEEKAAQREEEAARSSGGDSGGGDNNEGVRGHQKTE